MFVKLWHGKLDMPKYDLKWHQEDMADELAELQEAKGLVHIWSELSDVAYTYSRGKWSGHNLPRPLGRPRMIFGYTYMFPKYTLRYAFFRKAGKKVNPNARLREVRNPRKTQKLHQIAERNNLDPILFQRESEKLLKRWFLLP